MALSDFQRLDQFFGQGIAIARAAGGLLRRHLPVSSVFAALRSLGLESLLTIIPARCVAFIAQLAGLR